MRLLERKVNGEFSLTKNFIGNIPAYVILSHTWGDDDQEVTFKDINEGSGKFKTGYQKIRFCGEQATRDGYRYSWVDTCCIDKSDNAELTEALNSMYRWYENAAKCYVFLTDVSKKDMDRTRGQSQSGDEVLRKSTWFTRGWTLQELIAPQSVEFFSFEGELLGDKRNLEQQLHEITGIPVSALQGTPPSEFGVQERFSWAANRQTKKEEDKAYSLLGIFGVFLPLIYGEGQEHAFQRLRDEVDKRFRRHGGSKNTEERTFPAIYDIPFQKNPRFSGRSKILEYLRQKLLIDTDCQKLAIVGLGGIGKTQVALEFAHTVKENWPDHSVFWIPALSLESMEQACGRIARMRGISHVADEKEDVKEIVQQYLSNEASGNWLLVVDNADDAEILYGTSQSKGITDYLPQNEHGKILFTTRVQEIAVSLADNDVYELEEMYRQEAVDLLQKSLIRKELLDNNTVTTQLLAELTYLPLAITQAAAYLNKNKNTSIKDYLSLLGNTEQDTISLLNQEFHDGARYKSSKNAVARTWLISFDKIRDKDPVAADLLSFMSCIEWKGIPRSILPSIQPEERMVRAIGTLCGYSFLVKRADEDKYDIHRLVHLATGIWVENYGAGAETVKRAVRHIAEIFPKGNYDNRVVWREYLTHSLRLLKLDSSKAIDERYELCFEIGNCLYTEGRIREAVKWLEECCWWRERTLREEHPDRLASQHELAYIYEADGQISKALKLLDHVVIIREKNLSEEHPDRLASQHELARIYKADGQISKALKLLEQVVKIEKRTLSEEHPSRLASQYELACIYEADGQISKALKLLEQVVEIEKRTLSEEHPSRLVSQYQLAIVYKADGQITKAIELLEHVVMVRKKSLRADHPSLLRSQKTLRRYQQLSVQKE